MTDETARCSACGAEIIWCVHERTGKRAPIDAKASPDGNIVRLALNMFGETPYRVLGAAERTTPGDNDRYKNHFATCPNAGSFRKVDNVE